MTIQEAAITLGLSVIVSEQEIKVAYRKLAKEWHPDKCKGDALNAEQQMKKTNEAVDVLRKYVKDQSYFYGDKKQNRQDYSYTRYSDAKSKAYAEYLAAWRTYNILQVAFYKDYQDIETKANIQYDYAVNQARCIYDKGIHNLVTRPINKNIAHLGDIFIWLIHTMLLSNVECFWRVMCHPIIS